MKYLSLHRIVQTIAALRPVSWLFARSIRYLDRAVLKLSGGRKTLTSILAGLPVMVITTTGAKSGQPRTTPLVCIPTGQPGSYALVGSNFGQRKTPGWYYNLKAQPRFTGMIEGKAQAYLARETNGEEYDRLWQMAQEIYPGYRLYRERASHRRVPILIVSPVRD